MRADPLQLFPAHVEIGRTADGRPVRISEPFLRALGKLFERAGGATGPSTTDLNQSDDEDSGLYEFFAEQSKQNDGAAMAPIQQEHVSVDALLTELSCLRAEVAQLRTLINDIQQGTML